MNDIKLIFKVYGVIQRINTINKIAKDLNISNCNIFLDDRLNGGDALYTAKKAYLSSIGDATHLVVLQDDVELCNNFVDICYQIVAAHPDKIVSLFPFDYQIYSEQYENIGTPYLAVNIMSGCGVIMPVQYIKPCFNYIQSEFNDKIEDDKGIREWAEYAGIDIITTIPALIQHIGDRSILNKYRPIQRTYYFEKDPIADWSNPNIWKRPKIKEKFFSKRRMIKHE